MTLKAAQTGRLAVGAQLMAVALVVVCMLAVSTPALAAGTSAGQIHARTNDIVRHRDLQQAAQAPAAASAPGTTPPAAGSSVDYREPVFSASAVNTASDAALQNAARPCIKSPSPRVNGSPTQFFEVDFGGAPLDVNPLRLVNITGVLRYVSRSLSL